MRELARDLSFVVKLLDDVLDFLLREFIRTRQFDRAIPVEQRVVSAIDHAGCTFARFGLQLVAPNTFGTQTLCD